MRRALLTCCSLFALALMASCTANSPTSESPDQGVATPGLDQRDATERAEAQAPDASLASNAPPAGERLQAPPPRPEHTIYRSELARATHDGRPPYLMQQLGPEAYRPNGRFIGWKITKVWPSDPELCAPGCDLQPGDVIVAVNGRPIEYPEHLSELMEKLPKMETLKIRMLRNGELRVNEYAIAED